MSQEYEITQFIDAQPFAPFFDMYIAGHRFTDIPPKYIQSFEIVRSASVESSGSTFTLTVIDKYWDEVEEILHMGANLITFRYGHATGRQSRMYYGRVTDYTLQFLSSAVQLTVSGMVDGAVTNLDPKTASIEGTTPDQAVVNICKMMGWGIGRIDPAAVIKDADGTIKQFALVKDKPINYIVREIAPRSIRTSDGKGGYQFYLDASHNPPVAHFHPIDINPNSERTYIYQKGINSVVKSFTPQNQGIFGASGILRTASNLETTTIDPITKEENTQTRNVNVKKDVTGEYSPVASDQSTLTLDSAGMTKEESSMFLEYRVTSDAAPYTAELEIIGDPTLEVMQTIRVIVITDQGKLHHTSGRYMIQNITDSISGGVLTTTLSLQRNGDLDGGVEVLKYETLLK